MVTAPRRPMAIGFQVLLHPHVPQTNSLKTQVRVEHFEQDLEVLCGELGPRLSGGLAGLECRALHLQVGTSALVYCNVRKTAASLSPYPLRRPEPSTLRPQTLKPMISCYAGRRAVPHRRSASRRT